jgi:hypothetical protein
VNRRQLFTGLAGIVGQAWLPERTYSFVGGWALQPWELPNANRCTVQVGRGYFGWFVYDGAIFVPSPPPGARQAKLIAHGQGVPPWLRS